MPGLDLTNTEIAYKHLSEKELKKMALLFKAFQSEALVDIGNFMAYWGLKLRVPGIKFGVKKTVYDIFCGGETLQDCEPLIKRHKENGILTILDYGVEDNQMLDQFQSTFKENLRSLQFAEDHSTVPVISLKISGLASTALLESVQKGQSLSDDQVHIYEELWRKMEDLCAAAVKNETAVFIDAEESWVQDVIDKIAIHMMSKYNRKRIHIYNTYQLYRVDKLDQLKRDHQRAQTENYILGAKVVRGAYIDKERERAQKYGYKSPIHPTKAETDKCYNEGVRYCVDHYESIASCNASHNIESNELQAKLIADKNIERNHQHLNFCQLLGMADYITYNLADAGYNVAKYVPYGKVHQVMPYLIRRAQENRAVSGEFSREYFYLTKELKRRRINLL